MRGTLLHSAISRWTLDLYAVLERLPYLPAQFHERRIRLHVLAARPPERNLQHALHAGGPRREQHDAVGEVDRLLDRVGDEQHRLALALPDVEELVLQEI